MRQLFLIVCTATIAVPFSIPALAQTYVLPPEARTVEGNRFQGANWRGPRLHQTIYASSAVQMPPSMQRINQLSLRPDAGRSSLARSYDVTVTMSSQGVPSPEYAHRTSYAHNLGTDALTVFQPRRVQFPAVTVSQGVQPFVIALPFDAPFTYRQPNNLLIQLEFAPVVPTDDPNQWPLDAMSYPSTSWGLATTEYGTGCPTPGRWSTGVNTIPPGDQGLLMVYQSDVLPQTVAQFALGFSDRNIGPFPLPLNLGLIGAPGCHLYQDMVAVMNASVIGPVTDRLLVGTLPLPRNFALTGLRFFVQGLMLNVSTPSLGFRTTSGLRVELQTPPSPYLGLTLYGHPGGVPEVVLPNFVPVFGVN